jgi:hypothetical protein
MQPPEAHVTINQSARFRVIGSLSCQQVSDQLRKHGHEQHNYYRNPEQSHAGTTTPSTALVSSTVDLPEAQHEQKNGSADQPRTKRCNPDTRARQAQSAHNSKGQTAGQRGQHREYGSYRGAVLNRFHECSPSPSAETAFSDLRAILGFVPILSVLSKKQFGQTKPDFPSPNPPDHLQSV